MAKCLILKSFKSKVKGAPQRNKGETASLVGEELAFAQEHGCVAKTVKPTPVKE